MDISKKLLKIRNLLYLGDLRVALLKIEHLESNLDLSAEERIDSLLLKSETLLKIGKYKEAKRLSHQVLKAYDNNDGKILQRVDALSIIAEAYLQFGNYTESLALIEKGEELLNRMDKQSSERTLNESKLDYLKVFNTFMKGEVETASQLGNKALISIQEHQHKRIETELLRLVGIIYWNKGELKKAHDYFRDSFSLSVELKDKYGLGRSLSRIGSIHQFKGSNYFALEYKANAIKILEEIGEKRYHGLTLQHIGEIYQAKGELNLAFHYTQRSLNIFTDLDTKHSLAENYLIIGEILKDKGNFDAALSFYHKSLILHNEVERIGTRPLVRMAEIHHLRREYDLAFEYYERSLVFFERVQYFLGEGSSIFYNLIKLCVDIYDFEKARYYFNRLKTINEKEENMVTDQQVRLAQALLLKPNKRFIDLAAAQQLYLQIAEEEISEINLTVEALLNLCDLLIYELKTTGTKEIITDLNKWLKNLLNFAKSQQSYSLLAETYTLQSKLALLELDLDKAEDLLDRAEKIAIDKGMSKLASEVLIEKKLMENQTSKFQEFKKQIEAPPIGYILELTQFEGAIGRSLRSRNYPQEEEILQYASKVRARFGVKDEQT